MKRTPILLSLFIFGLSHQAWSENPKYIFKKGEIQSLQIIGYKGDVEVVGSSSETTQIEVIAEGGVKAPEAVTWSWGPSMRRTGQQAELRIEGPLSKKDWQTVMDSDRWPSYKIRVSGLSVPLRVFLREGRVGINHWTQSVQAHGLEGQIQARDGQGEFKASLQKGKIVLRDQKGRVDLSGLDLSAEVTNLTGDLNLRSQRGAVTLKDLKGLINLENDQGHTTVKGLNGALNFTNGSGEMLLSGVNGGVDGHTASGPVELSYSGEGEVQMQSGAGKVTLRVPNAAAPYVVLTSEDGDLFVPSYFHVVNQSANKTAKGRVRGQSREGSIKVTSKTADILLR